MYYLGVINIFLRKLGNKALIVTARDMNNSERRRYEKNKELKEMSIMEASDFWDEHDFSEFDDIKAVKDIRFSLEKKKYIGIDELLYSKIQKKAKKLHKSEEALIKEWLSEKAEEQSLPI